MAAPSASMTKILSVHTAASCQFGTPTVFVDAPIWFQAEQSPWTCLQPETPRVLDATEGCASCACWQPNQRKQQASPAA